MPTNSSIFSIAGQGRDTIATSKQDISVSGSHNRIVLHMVDKIPTKTLFALARLGSGFFVRLFCAHLFLGRLGSALGSRLGSVFGSRLGSALRGFRRLHHRVGVVRFSQLPQKASFFVVVLIKDCQRRLWRKFCFIGIFMSQQKQRSTLGFGWESSASSRSFVVALVAGRKRRSFDCSFSRRRVRCRSAFDGARNRFLALVTACSRKTRCASRHLVSLGTLCSDSVCRVAANGSLHRR